MQHAALTVEGVLVAAGGDLVLLAGLGEAERAVLRDVDARGHRRVHARLAAEAVDQDGRLVGVAGALGRRQGAGRVGGHADVEGPARGRQRLVVQQRRVGGREEGARAAAGLAGLERGEGRGGEGEGEGGGEEGEGGEQGRHVAGLVAWYGVGEMWWRVVRWFVEMGDVV